MVVVALRNGFGFDVEIVNDMPVWAWTQEGADKNEDVPDAVATFDGMVFDLPFLKIMVGNVGDIYE
jgi:hypothetical protein